MKKLMYAGLICLGMFAVSCGPTKTDENGTVSPGEERGTDGEDSNPQNTSDPAYNDYNSRDSTGQEKMDDSMHGN